MSECNHSVLPERKLTEDNSTVAERALANPTRLQGNTRWRTAQTAYAIIYRKEKSPQVIWKRAEEGYGSFGGSRA